MSRSDEIRTTFFMCRMGRIVYASVELSFWTQPLGRVLWLPFVPYFEVQARPLERAGVSDGADQLPLLDLVALGDPDVGRVGVDRVVLPAVIHDDQVPVTPEPSCVDHVAGEHRRDIRALGRLDVDPVPERLRPEARVDLRAVLADHPAVRRPGEPSP